MLACAALPYLECQVTKVLSGMIVPAAISSAQWQATRLSPTGRSSGAAS